MKSNVVFIFLVCFFVTISADDPDDYHRNEASVWEHVWVGDSISKSYKIKVNVPFESKLYDVMVAAQNRNSNFAFKSIFYTSLGHFITQIGEYAQVPVENKYWLIFITDRAPRRSNPPGQADLSPLGVSSLVIKDGYHYLFWLRTANFTHT